jgi:hypothetical protein
VSLVRIDTAYSLSCSGSLNTESLATRPRLSFPGGFKIDVTSENDFLREKNERRSDPGDAPDRAAPAPPAALLASADVATVVFKVEYVRLRLLPDGEVGDARPVSSGPKARISCVSVRARSVRVRRTGEPNPSASDDAGGVPSAGEIRIVATFDVEDAVSTKQQRSLASLLSSSSSLVVANTYNRSKVPSATALALCRVARRLLCLQALPCSVDLLPRSKHQFCYLFHNQQYHNNKTSSKNNITHTHSWIRDSITNQLSLLTLKLIVQHATTTMTMIIVCLFVCLCACAHT